MEENEDFWNLIGFVLASENRRKVMICLEKGFATPKEIADKCGIRIGHVSNILLGLKQREIVTCRNPEAKRGRIYSLTDLGVEVVVSIQRARNV